ncbi:MAG: hypothetical protein KGY75_01775 [Candidatus Cloacimonetes bacterium]|nr:hypothetical protein [Candidatus Cloacimonadota bacterium]MBS3766840.1 hypothetical protein [Candidatus Cloacimonadota bacterium]
MQKSKIVIAILVLAVFLTAFITVGNLNALEEGANSDDEETSQQSAEKGLLPFPTSVGIGAVTIGDQMYTRIRLLPEFRFWKFRLGLDFDILMDSNGKIREKDWDDFEDYLNKILYLQFAQRQDPFYFRLGGFSDLKFGHGLIMNDYTNMLNYPDVKQLGAEVAVNTNLYGLGFDVFSSNLERNDLLAGRITLNPFQFSNIPLIENMKVGATAVTDRDQFSTIRARKEDYFPDKAEDMDEDDWLYVWELINGDSTGFNNWYEEHEDSLHIHDYPENLDEEKEVTELGLDYTLPLINTKTFSLYNYGEYAKILDYGHGFVFPGFGAEFLIFNAQLDYRLFGEEFQANYFNRLYDDERARVENDTMLVTKASTLNGLSKSQGWRGMLAANILDFVTVSMEYEDITGDNYPVGKSIMAGVRLNKTLIPQIAYAYAKYSQVNVEEIQKWKSPNASIDAQVGYNLSSNSLLIWEYREHYIDKNDDGEIKGSNETVSSYSLGVQLRL